MMPETSDADAAKQGRIIAVVIALAGISSIAAPWIVQVTGLGPRFEILIYLFAMAAFIWSLVVTWKLWQKTRK